MVSPVGLFPAAGTNAKDLTQAFFERFLEKHSVKEVLREKGRFRTSLLTTLRRFLCDQFDRATAIKRGGGVHWVAWDAAEGEAQFSQATGAAGSPEELFDRAWAETIVQVSVERLRMEHEAAGQGRWFDELKGHLSQPTDLAQWTKLAVRTNLTGTVDYTPPTSAAAQRFYRVVVP